MKFSIAMCVYSGDHYENFDISLKSIVEQTIRPTEIVLTVDGPIPSETEAVIEKYTIITKENNIEFNVVKLEKNVGHGEARRISVHNCKYDVIAIMDADDISNPCRFERQLSFMEEHPDVSIVGSNIIEFIDQPGLPQDTSVIAGQRVVPIDDESIKQYMKKRCPMNQMTVVFRKHDIDDVGGYLDWYCNEDYYLWIRLALAKKRFANIDENLVVVRVGKEMYERRGGLKYFKSEFKLQTLMYKKGIISVGRYFSNVIERFILQVLMPNKLRGFVFRTLARK